jgi:hypothetical protein
VGGKSKPVWFPEREGGVCVCVCVCNTHPSSRGRQGMQSRSGETPRGGGNGSRNNGTLLADMKHCEPDKGAEQSGLTELL